MPPGNENSASLEGQNALRVKVAELSKGRIKCLSDRHFPQGVWFYIDDFGVSRKCINNDPLLDLNACAEFEKGLTREQQYKYALILLRLPEIGYGGTEPMSCCFPVISATAEQRCRAFVATMEGKEK